MAARISAWPVLPQTFKQSIKLQIIYQTTAHNFAYTARNDRTNTAGLDVTPVQLKQKLSDL